MADYDYIVIAITVRKVDECNENSQWLEDRNGRLLYVSKCHITKCGFCDQNSSDEERLVHII